MCVCIHTLQLLVSWCSGFLGPIPSGKGIGTKPPNHYRWWFQRFFPQFSPQNWRKGSNLTMRIVFQRLVKPPTRFTITLRILTPLKGLFWGHIYTPAKEQVHSLLHWRVPMLLSKGDFTPLIYCTFILHWSVVHLYSINLFYIYFTSITFRSGHF